MSSRTYVVHRTIAVGITLSLFAILFGFVLGGLFGSVEGSIKKHLDLSGTAALQSAYQGDVAAKDAVVRKAWTYLKRAHLHGGAIGSASLATTLALVLLCPAGRLVQSSALAFGLGAVLYSLFWLLAGFAAPGLGSTSVAKESLSFVAIPGAGLCIFGLCGAIFSIVKASFFPSHEV